jgi:hypothetical protein
MLTMRPAVTSRWIPAAMLLLSAAVPAQVMEIRSVTAPAPDLLSQLRLRQQEFEGYRREHLPVADLGRGPSGKCDEIIGRFCYWYDESTVGVPPEPEDITRQRFLFLAQLDTASRAFPGDRWTAGALVRYLVEAGRTDDAVEAAERCEVRGWWCAALRGFALHADQRYDASDSAWTAALKAMDPREACDFRDLKLILDDGLLRSYRNASCDERAQQELRIWWLARPTLATRGNDARTEFLSRRLYQAFLEDAPSIHSQGFDSDEREMMLRYGWARAWSRSKGVMPGTRTPMITGYEPTPAPPMLPMATTIVNPALSDSIGWRGKGLPGVRARYSPDHARNLRSLRHQSAIFRRGDSALVVMAYDIAADRTLSPLAGTDRLTAALVLTRGEEGDASVVRLPAAPARGTLTAMSPWAPMLMSAEVVGVGTSTLSRARYGMRASEFPTSRVAISDLLLFEPYEGMPRRLEDVLPHVSASQLVPEGNKVGIYWETYNTDPTGEGIEVSITVAPEQKDGSWLRRGLTALKLARESQPVSVGITDQSARGRGFTPRAVVVDLATLKPGRYLMQLEVTASGTAPVRAERVITIRSPR